MSDFPITPEIPQHNLEEVPPQGLNIVPSPNGSTIPKGALQSPNFQPGVSGWIIRADGTAEFQSVTITGSGAYQLASGTISQNTNVALATTPGTNTDTVVPHTLGRVPKVITISCKIKADGNTNDQEAVGTVFYDSSGGVLGGFFIQVDQIGTLGSTNVLLQNQQNMYAASAGGDRATITVSILSVDATNFTFRINGTKVGTPPSPCTVTGISWKVEG